MGLEEMDEYISIVKQNCEERIAKLAERDKRNEEAIKIINERENVLKKRFRYLLFEEIGIVRLHIPNCYRLGNVSKSEIESIKSIKAAISWIIDEICNYKNNLKICNNDVILNDVAINKFKDLLANSIYYSITTKGEFILSKDGAHFDDEFSSILYYSNISKYLFPANTLRLYVNKDEVKCYTSSEKCVDEVSLEDYKTIWRSKEKLKTR